MELLVGKFKNMMPRRLTNEEFDQLQANCLNEGIREPLLYWTDSRRQHHLVDGHHRYEIAMEHKLPFKVEHVPIETNDPDDVIFWAHCRQLGRRNLVHGEVRLLRAAVAESRRKRMGAAKAWQDAARQFGVSVGTIQRDRQYAKAHRKLDPQTQNFLQRTKVAHSPAALTKLSKMTPEERQKVIERIQKTKTKTNSPSLDKTFHQIALEELPIGAEAAVVHPDPDHIGNTAVDIERRVRMRLQINQLIVDLESLGNPRAEKHIKSLRQVKHFIYGLSLCRKS